jgi:uncharacterized protein YdaU (DUF1376 family)
MSKRRAKQKPDAWMPLFIGDYLRDTASLTTEQHGAYLLLLMAMWPQGGRIPVDEDEQAAITRLGVKGWKAQRTRLLRYFRVADGYLIHDRMAEEYAHAMEVYRKRVESGKQGGRPPEPDLFTETERLAERGGEWAPESPPQSHSQPPSSPNNEASGEIPKRPLSQRARASARKVCKALAQRNVDCSTLDESLVIALQEGFTADEIIALSLTRKGAGKPMAYLLATLRGKRSDAQADDTPGGVLIAAPDPELERLQAERTLLVNLIYDARHQHDTLESITATERDERIKHARERIGEVEAAIEAQGAIACAASQTAHRE